MGIITNRIAAGWIDKMIDKHRKQSDGSLISKYDPAHQKPVLHKSICTGETTAGFKDLTTGKYTDIMLIRNDEDMRTFMKEYGISEPLETEY